MSDIDRKSQMFVPSAEGRRTMQPNPAFAKAALDYAAKVAAVSDIDLDAIEKRAAFCAGLPGFHPWMDNYAEDVGPLGAEVRRLQAERDAVVDYISSVAASHHRGASAERLGEIADRVRALLSVTHQGEQP